MYERIPANTKNIADTRRNSYSPNHPNHLSSMVGNQSALLAMQRQADYSSCPIQRISDPEIQQIIDHVLSFFGFHITRAQVENILLNAYQTSGRPYLRDWLDHISFDCALDIVKATISQTPRPAQHVATFGDKDLQSADRAAQHGAISHATFLEDGSDPEIATRRQRILDGGGDVTGTVRICTGGIFDQTAKAPYHIPSAPEATEGRFDFPWTSGLVTNSDTRANVQELTADFGAQMAQEQLPRMSMTLKWNQNRHGKSIRAPHRLAYTTQFPQWSLTCAESADPSMSHAKTVGGTSTVHPETEGVTFHYTNFAVQFRPLLDAARAYRTLPNSQNQEWFINRLDHDVSSCYFPQDLKTDLTRNHEDLGICADLIINYRPAACTEPEVKPFGSYDPKPDDDSAYRFQGVGPFQYI